MSTALMPKTLSIKSIFSLFLISTAFSFASPVEAQIIPDNTLGTEASRLNQNQIINGAPGDKIEDGAIRGSNLFHSFSEFNIKYGQRVYFVNPTGIENILTRVTGGKASNIFGTLGVAGTANLFLINPAGILFGQNASLDLQGSFVATTANGVQFGNQELFSTINPQTPSLLMVNVPTGLQYGQNPGAIQVQRANLQAPNSQTLTLAGGTVNIDGGQLLAPSGRVELGGISAGTVGLNSNGNLSFSDNVAKADVSITNAAKVDVSADGGGSIAINARNLEVREGSQLLAGIREGLGTPEAQAGDITINATAKVQFDGEDKDGNNSGAFNQVNSGAKGNAGSIFITTDSLQLLNGAQLSTSIDGVGNTGSVTINANNLVTFDGEDKAGNDSGAFSNVNSEAKGNTRGVSINTGSLKVTNGAQLDSSTFGVGNTGSVTINAADFIKFDGEGKDEFESGARSEVLFEAADGKSGGVFITTKSLEATNGAQLSASITGTTVPGNAGGVTINATDWVKFDGGTKNGLFASGAYSQVNPNAKGNAGSVFISTGTLEVLNGAQLAASTFGVGDAGSVTIYATGLVKFDGEGKMLNPSGALSNVRNTRNSSAVGNAGGVSITARSLEVLNGGRISTRTDGVGKAGIIKIGAKDYVLFDGKSKDGFSGGAFSDVRSTAFGDAGGISINTDFLKVTNGAEVSVSTLGQGNAGSVEIIANTFESSNGGQLVSRTSSQFEAGNIILKVKDNITLSGSNTGIFANTTSGSAGKAGSIIIDPRAFIIRDGATISANSQGEGIGGDIKLKAGALSLNNGKISAETRSNTGGNITLDVQDLLLLRNGSKISTNAGTERAGGNGGNITFNGKFIVAIPSENSDISANAYTGNGGNIQINSQGIFGIESRPKPTDKSDITASSELGISGVINLNTPDNSSIQNNFTELSPNLINTNALIANSCIARGAKLQENSFTITGSGALRNSPGNALISAYTTGDVRNVEPTSRPWKKGDPIVEPQGLYRLPNGQLLLSRACI